MIKRSVGAVRLAEATKPVMSKSDLARKLKVSPQAVSAWVTGKATPTPDTLRRIEDLFGIPMRAWTEDSKQGAA